MQELMKDLRGNMRSNMNKIINIMESEIFYRVGESYGIKDWQKIIPHFIFPEDPETEEEVIRREERKAATLTSLSNSIQILINGMTAITDTAAKQKLLDAIGVTSDIYISTVKTFDVNNDQDTGKVEEEFPEKDIQIQNSLTLDAMDQLQSQSAESVQVESSFPTVTLIDDIQLIRDPKYILVRHTLIHQLYEAVIKGAKVFDADTSAVITLPAIVQKHKQYITYMEKLGMVHESSEVGKDLDLMMTYG